MIECGRVRVCGIMKSEGRIEMVMMKRENRL